MSELKAYIGPAPDEKGLADYYLKSEADKVIADKDKEIVELKGQVNGFKNRSNLWKYNAVEEHRKLVQADKVIAELKADYKEACDRLQTANLIKDEKLAEARHHKYKRCLAMAKWCHDKWTMSLGWDPADGHTADFFLHHKKWEKRWLELAEKFKEAK